MLNKRNVLAAGVLVAGSMMFAGAAQAAEMENWTDNTYVGLDIIKASVDFATDGGVNYNSIYHDSFTGLNPYVGYRFSDSFGAEIGYIETGDKSKTVSATTNAAVSVTGTTKAELRSWHVDGIYNYDLMDHMPLIGSLGFERTHFRTTTALTTTATVKGSNRETALRVGLGLGYRFADGLSARFMARYADTDFDNTADSTMYYSIGLSYDF